MLQTSLYPRTEEQRQDEQCYDAHEARKAIEATNCYPISTTVGDPDFDYFVNNIRVNLLPKIVESLHQDDLIGLYYLAQKLSLAPPQADYEPYGGHWIRVIETYVTRPRPRRMKNK